MIALLTSRLAGPIAAGVAVLLAILLGVQTIRLASAQRTASVAMQARDDALRDLGTCRGNVSRLEAGVTAQNAALQAAKADGDRRAADLTKALQAARKTALASTLRADRLEAFRPVATDACAAMLEVDEMVRTGR